MYGIDQDITERRQAEQEQRLTLEQLRALAARFQSAREEERTRLAREIHDELGQALTAIKIDLASLIAELHRLRAGSKRAALEPEQAEFAGKLPAENVEMMERHA